MSRTRILISGILLVLATATVAAGDREASPWIPAPSGAVGEVRTPEAVSWQIRIPHDGARLVVTGPDGLLVERSFEPYEAMVLEAAGLPDGQYRYEVRVDPLVDAATRERLRQAREAGDASVVRELKASGVLPSDPGVLSGHFRVSGSTIVLPSDIEASRSQTRTADPEGVPDRDGVAKDQVFADDLIVTGSACIGAGCANGESFGFDTILLKEDNLRIAFRDTSYIAGYPTNDWQLVANESTNGGLSMFGIEDIDGGRRPFLIEAGAPANSLYVDDGGRLGLGTAAPVYDIHAVSGDTPTLRLQQDSSYGWTPQTWDVSGNETNFFVRDVSHSSNLPFRIRAAAPTNSLYIESTGNLGVGTQNPAASLEIERTGSDAELRLHRTDGVGSEWSLRARGDGSFTIGAPGGADFITLKSSGAMVAAGPVDALSDRNAKQGFEPIDRSALLRRLEGLDISTWSFIAEGPDVLHLGPTAQDFRAAFGLGADDRHITLSDLGGVALAAVQALCDEIEVRDRRILDLEQRLAALEARLAPPAATP